jgi:succinate-semialdehyde dehydrogenase / glutarate-semialdehyde dehydrogenase
VRHALNFMQSTCGPETIPETIPETMMSYQSVDPSSGELLAQHPAHTPAEVEALLSAAHAAHADWRRRPLAERTAALTALAGVFERDADRLALLLTSEMGKPLAQVRGEVMKCVDGLRYYATNAERFLAPRDVDGLGGLRNIVRYDPIGTVLAIMPWNFPYWQPTRMIAPVIAGGNTLLLKSAPNTMGTGEAIVAAAAEAGLPDGIVQTLRAEPDVIAHVIADVRIQGVSFTGSTRGGRAVAAIAGANGKRTVLELGGSDPFVVLEDADVARAAARASDARLLNCGQSCIAAKRFVVHRSVAAEFTEAMAAGLRAAVVGDPRDAATTVGPMARDDLRVELVGQVARSVSAGAQVVVPGGRRDGAGYFYEPTLLTGVTPAHAVGGEETFGPAGAILVVDSEEEALAVANDTEYGLGSSVWSADIERAERFAARIDAGMVTINDMNASDVRMPFGGVKASGYGRELAEEGIREFMNVKSVRVAG